MKEALLIRLSAEERETLEALAKEWGVSLAGSVRRLIREADRQTRNPTRVIARVTEKEQQHDPENADRLRAETA